MCMCYKHVVCTNAAGVDNVFTIHSAYDFAQADQHSGPGNATSMLTV